jgi:hypothetical protein
MSSGETSPTDPPGRPPEALLLTPFGDGTYWIVRENFEWNLTLARTRLDPTIHAVVPQGFVTDFASIPRPFWVLLPKWEGYGSPSVVHDFLYANQKTSRYEADQWMLLGMKVMKVGKIKRHTIYAVVRLFGRFAWASNAKKKILGKHSCIDAKEFDKLTLSTTWADLRKLAVPCQQNLE